ncbi:MAG TPA: hypothetical protein VGN14_04910 [Candidatus Elarobacter sp.]
MIRLIAAAGAFTGTVIGGFVVGLLAAKVTGAGLWIPVGLFGGLALGVAMIAVALRPFLRS